MIAWESLYSIELLSSSLSSRRLMVHKLTVNNSEVGLKSFPSLEAHRVTLITVPSASVTDVLPV